MEDLIHYKLDETNSNLFFITVVNLKERERIELIHFLTINIEVFI